MHHASVNILVAPKVCRLETNALAKNTPAFDNLVVMSAFYQRQLYSRQNTVGINTLPVYDQGEERGQNLLAWAPLPFTSLVTPSICCNLALKFLLSLSCCYVSCMTFLVLSLSHSIRWVCLEECLCLQTIIPIITRSYFVSVSCAINHIASANCETIIYYIMQCFMIVACRLWPCYLGVNL